MFSIHVKRACEVPSTPPYLTSSSSIAGERRRHRRDLLRVRCRWPRGHGRQRADTCTCNVDRQSFTSAVGPWPPTVRWEGKAASSVAMKSRKGLTMLLIIIIGEVYRCAVFCCVVVWGWAGGGSDSLHHVAWERNGCLVSTIMLSSGPL